MEDRMKRLDKEAIEHELGRCFTQKEYRMAASLKLMETASRYVAIHAPALFCAMMFPRGRGPKGHRDAFKRYFDAELRYLRMALKVLSDGAKRLPKK